MRTLARIGAIGVLATLALAVSLLGGPRPPAEQAVRLAVVSRSGGLGTLDPRPELHRRLRVDPRPAVERRRQVTVLMSGDLLWHDSVWQSAHEDAVRRGEHRRFDFDPMFAAMKPLVEHADLAICHEEVPFAADDQHLSSYPIFGAPPEVARWIGSMGWDACTTDSNHSIDQGFAGLVRTATLLERAGVRHVGTFRDRAERRTPVVITTRQGVKVGIVGGTYSLNGLSLPADQRWAVSTWDADNLIAQARAARAAGADIVLVQYHGGTEYSRLPNGQQVALVRRLTASPFVDAVFAEHAHVVQPITRVHGKWVVYGMGNMVGQSDPAYPRAYEGISIELTFGETPRGFRVTRAAYIPISWDHYSPGHPIRVLPVLASLSRGAGDRARLLRALRMTRLAVDGASPRGTPTAGLRRK